MSGTVRLGLVGAGAIARAYVEAVEGCEGARLVAVADIEPHAARALCATTGAAALSSHRDLAASGCEAVIVTTPPVTHAPIVLDLLARGLPVLCEKPLSIDLDAAREMAACAADTGVPLTMASKFRFVEDVVAAKAIVERGEIGTVRLADNLFTSVVDMRGRWNSDPTVSGGGVLIDNATHSVDLVRYLVGPIVEVLALAGPRLQATPVEDHAWLFARTREGAAVTVETSWSVHKDRGAFLSLYGSEGALEIGWKGSRLRRSPTGPWEAFGAGYDKRAAFARQVESFLAALRGDAAALPDLEDGLASVAVIQAAYTSLARGTLVPVEEAVAPAAPAHRLAAVP